MQCEDDDVEAALSSLFSQLSESPLDGTGAWSFGSEGREVGFVLMEQGGVCFATARGLNQRLTDLIVEHHGVEREEVEAVWDQCRVRRTPIVEALAEHNLLSPSALEAVLLQHTAESIEKLASLRPESAVWLPHAGAGYRPRFTFALPNVMARALAHASGADGAELEARLARLGDAHTTLIAYAEASQLPLAMAGPLKLDLTDLYEIGWVAHTLLDRLAMTEPRLISAASSLGTFLTFLRSGLCTVVLSTQPSSTARLLGRFMRGDYGDL